MRGNLVSLCPATMSEGGAFMKPPPFERLIHGDVCYKILKNAMGDWEPSTLF